MSKAEAKGKGLTMEDRVEALERWRAEVADPAIKTLESLRYDVEESLGEMAKSVAEVQNEHGGLLAAVELASKRIEALGGQFDAVMMPIQAALLGISSEQAGINGKLDNLLKKGNGGTV